MELLQIYINYFCDASLAEIVRSSFFFFAWTALARKFSRPATRSPFSGIFPRLLPFYDVRRNFRLTEFAYLFMLSAAV
jgi:hypothetical protein